MSTRHITVNDAGGSDLDLVRPVVREINFKYPEDYTGEKHDPVKQQALFIREADRHDDGTVTFTTWQSEQPFWTVYEVPKVAGLRPNITAVPSENVTVDRRPITKFEVQYAHAIDDEQEPATNENAEPQPEQPDSIQTEKPAESKGEEPVKKEPKNSPNPADDSSSARASSENESAKKDLIQTEKPVESKSTEKEAPKKPAKKQSGVQALAKATESAIAKIIAGNAGKNKLLKDKPSQKGLVDPKPLTFAVPTLKREFRKYEPLSLPTRYATMANDPDTKATMDALAIVGKAQVSVDGYQVTMFDHQ